LHLSGADVHNHRRKFAAFFLFFFIVGYSAQAYAFLPILLTGVRAALARFVPTSAAVIRVSPTGAKQLEILSTRFAAKYPQGAGSSILVMRRIGGTVAGTFLGAFLIDAGYNLLTTPAGSCVDWMYSGTGAVSTDRASLQAIGDSRAAGFSFASANGWVYDAALTGANGGRAVFSNYYTPTLNNGGPYTDSVSCLSVTTSPTVSGDSLDSMIVEYESLPDQASKDSWAVNKGNQVKNFSAANPSLSFDDSIALLEGGSLNGIGYSLDANGKGHVYTSDPSGNISVDGQPVNESKSPDFSNTATYTDSNGVLHTLSYDGNGNLLDNGIVVSFGSSTSSVSSQTVDAAGNKTTTTTTTNQDGTSSSTSITTDPTGSIISQTSTGTTTSPSTTQADNKALAESTGFGLSDALGKKLHLFDGDAGGSRPVMQFHLDGKLVHSTDMTSEYSSLGVSSMMGAIMGTFGMLISSILVGRAIMS